MYVFYNEQRSCDILVELKSTIFYEVRSTEIICKLMK
jgi:hypothetical protein